MNALIVDKFVFLQNHDMCEEVKNLIKLYSSFGIKNSRKVSYYTGFQCCDPYRLFTA